MPPPAHQAYRFRDASLIAAARLDCLVWLYPHRLSRRAICGVGLVAMAIAAIAYLRGADVLAGFAGSQPPLLPLVTGVTDDERT
jgi:hypothetical protein